MGAPLRVDRAQRLALPYTNEVGRLVMGKRVGIVGTRFSDLHSPVWRETLRNLISSLPDDAEVIVNGAPGADEEAARLAQERGLQVHVLFPDEYYGDDYRNDPSHFVHRNGAVVDFADEVHAVWDGNSHGTQHAITLAKHRGVPIHVHNVLQADWQRFS